MSNGTMIIKRDGSKEHLNIDKIHKVVMHACEGLAGVSASLIEMNANSKPASFRKHNMLSNKSRVQFSETPKDAWEFFPPRFF